MKKSGLELPELYAGILIARARQKASKIQELFEKSAKPRKPRSKIVKPQKPQSEEIVFDEVNGRNFILSACDRVDLDDIKFLAEFLGREDPRFNDGEYDLFHSIVSKNYQIDETARGGTRLINSACWSTEGLVKLSQTGLAAHLLERTASGQSLEDITLPFGDPAYAEALIYRREGVPAPEELVDLKL